MKKKAAPLINRVAAQLRKEHARGLGGIHVGAQGGGCETCALLREAGRAGVISGPWPSVIAWDGSVWNDEAASASGGEGEG